MDIFSPLDIGSVSFPNRTVMAPAVINSAGPDGLAPASAFFAGPTAAGSTFDAPCSE